MATATCEPACDTGQSFPADLGSGGPAPLPVCYPLPDLSSWEARQRAPVGLRPRRPVSPADRRLPARRTPVRPGGNLSPGYRAAKRLVDVLGALGLLVMLGPVMLAVFLVLLVTTRGRPLFWQRRIGHCGRSFRMVKFRTMVADAAQRRHEVPNEQDGPIFKNRRDPRITRIGRLLRKTSLDETPQLFNVLLGNMSLVGPRPPLGQEVALYKAWQLGRLVVKPGLTCLWQVSGRSEIGFEDWVRLDIWYVRNQGLWTDLWLLFRTPASVLSGRGAY